MSSTSEHDAPGAPRIAFDIVEQLREQGGRAEPLVLLELAGELDFAAGPRLGQRLSALIDSGSRRLLIDLSRITFIDSMAIGMLVGAATRLGELAGGSLAVVCSGQNERVLRIFDIAGVAALIPLHRTRTEALEVIPAPPAPTPPRPEPGAGAGELDPLPTGSARSAPGAARRYVGGEGPEDGQRSSSSAGSRRVDELA